MYKNVREPYLKKMKCRKGVFFCEKNKLPALKYLSAFTSKVSVIKMLFTKICQLLEVAGNLMWAELVPQHPKFRRSSQIYS